MDFWKEYWKKIYHLVLAMIYAVVAGVILCTILVCVFLPIVLAFTIHWWYIFFCLIGLPLAAVIIDWVERSKIGNNT